MGYLNTDGLVIGSDLERFSGRVNLDSKFKFLTLGVNSSYSYSIQNGFAQSTAGSMNSPVTLAISGRTALDPFYDENGDYLEGNYPHPLAVVDSKTGSLYRTKVQTVNANPYLQVDFGKGIYAKTTLGVNITDQNIYTYYSALYDPNGVDSNGLGTDFTSKTSVITWTNVLGWNYTFNEKHAVNLMLGQEMQRKFYNYSVLEGTDFPFGGRRYARPVDGRFVERFGLLQVRGDAGFLLRGRTLRLRRQVLRVGFVPPRRFVGVRFRQPLG